MGTLAAIGSMVGIPARYGASGLPEYVGQIATRSFVPTTKTGGTNYIMSRTAHVAVQDLTNLKLIFPGFAVQSGLDTAAASATTYHASIEYPAGTFTEVLWAGASTKAAPAGSTTGLSDAAVVSIPAGATFWVRNFANTAGGAGGGMPCTQPSTSTRWTAAGEASVLSNTSITDQTLSGTVTHGGTDAFVYPLAIVANTTKPTFLLLGDSRTVGSGMSPDASGNQGQFSPSLGTSYGYINAGIGGSYMSQFNVGGEQRTNLAAYCSHVVNGFGVNDFSLGARTQAQMQGDVFIFGRKFTGKVLLACTIAPYTTGSYGDAASQTVTANEAVRSAVNTYIRTVPAPYAACVDIAAAQEDAGNPGKWKSPGYTTDGLHASSTGYAAIVSAGTINGATLGAVAAVSQFSLLSLASNVAWGDIGNAASGSVTGTPLQSAGGRHSMAGGATPTYGATAFAGGPGYTFNGTSHGLVGDATYYKPFSSGLAGITLAALLQVPSTPASTKVLFGHAKGAANTERAMIMLDTSRRPGIHWRRLDADTVRTAFSTTALTADTPTLMVAVFDPTNNTTELFVNGVSVATGTYASTGSIEATSANNVVVGTMGAFGFTALVGREFDSFGAALTATQRQKVEGDIAWRAGLAASVLPSDHPYRSAAPVA